jgi:hypothetical protein
LTMAAMAKTAMAGAKGEKDDHKLSVKLMLKGNCVRCVRKSNHKTLKLFLFSAFGLPRWATFVKYGKVELMPPSPAELPAAFGQLAQLVKSGMTFQWRNVTVRVSKKLGLYRVLHFEYVV